MYTPSFNLPYHRQKQLGAAANNDTFATAGVTLPIRRCFCHRSAVEESRAEVERESLEGRAAAEPDGGGGAAAAEEEVPEEFLDPITATLMKASVRSHFRR